MLESIKVKDPCYKENLRVSWLSNHDETLERDERYTASVLVEILSSPTCILKIILAIFLVDNSCT